MGYNEFILVVNAVSIIILLVMTLMLCFAARFKGESYYVALFIFITTVLDFIYCVCGYFGWNDIALLMAPVAYSVNLTLMPVMLLLAHRAFNPYYSFRWKVLLHFLPMVVFAVLVGINICLMPPEMAANFTVHVTGFPALFTRINFLTVTVQLVIYFYWIFSYLRKVKHNILNTRSETELTSKVWVPKFITLVGAMVIVSMVCTLFDPFGGFRLFYFLNLVTMSFLLYSELQIVFTFNKHQLPTRETVDEMEADFIATGSPEPKADNREKDEMERLQRYARLVEDYFRTSEIYVNPNLSLKDVAKNTGISTNNLSKSINMVLNKNFFELVNGFRVEKSKELLLAKKERGLTLETIAEQCGFNSQYVYCRAFKKQTGVSTSEWLKISTKEQELN